MLILRKCEIVSLLHEVREWLILKKKQADILYDYMIDSPQALTRDDTFEQLRDLKNDYASIIVNASDLNDEYIAGFFDAEGCVTVQKTSGAYIAIGQSGNHSILEAIRSYFGSNAKRYKGLLNIWGDDGVRVAERIIPYSIVKKSQLEALLKIRKFAHIHYSRRTPEMVTEIETLKQFIKSAKHV